MALQSAPVIIAPATTRAIVGGSLPPICAGVRSFFAHLRARIAPVTAAVLLALTLVPAAPCGTLGSDSAAGGIEICTSSGLILIGGDPAPSETHDHDCPGCLAKTLAGMALIVEPPQPAWPMATARALFPDALAGTSLAIRAGPLGARAPPPVI